MFDSRYFASPAGPTCAIFTLIVGVLASIAQPASAAPMRFTARQQALLSFHRKPTVSWIRGDVAGSSAELVYASVLTSASTGETRSTSEAARRSRS